LKGIGLIMISFENSVGEVLLGGFQSVGIFLGQRILFPLPFFLNPIELIREGHGRLLWLNRVHIDASPFTGLIGSAKDVGRAMLALLNDGELDGNRILNDGSIVLLNERAPVDGH
jgi:hypothetical protein